MKEKITVPYIITMFGTIDIENKSIDEIKQELVKSNIQYLISKANSKFVELDEVEYENIKNNKRLK